MRPLQSSSLVLSAAVLLLQPLVYGQAFTLPQDAPTCATTCPLVTTAIQSCAADPASAATCFCQSATLTQVTNAAAGVNPCAPQCAEADFTSLQTWYRSYCANPAAPGGETQATTTAPAADGQPTTTPTAADQPAPTGTTLPPSYLENENVNRNESGSQWWSNHYQWVIMVIVLVLAFTALGVGGSIWYKKRQRKREGWDDPRPTMSEWAPSQHNVHDFSNPQLAQSGGAAAVPAAHRGRNGRSRASNVPVNQDASTGKKLKRALGRK